MPVTARSLRLAVGRLRDSERACRRYYQDTGQPRYLAHADLLRKRWLELAARLPALEWVEKGTYA